MNKTQSKLLSILLAGMIISGGLIGFVSIGSQNSTAEVTIYESENDALNCVDDAAIGVGSTLAVVSGGLTFGTTSTVGVGGLTYVTTSNAADPCWTDKTQEIANSVEQAAGDDAQLRGYEWATQTAAVNNNHFSTEKGGYDGYKQQIPAVAMTYAKYGLNEEFLNGSSESTAINTAKSESKDYYAIQDGEQINHAINLMQGVSSAQAQTSNYTEEVVFIGHVQSDDSIQWTNSAGNRWTVNDTDLAQANSQTVSLPNGETAEVMSIYAEDSNQSPDTSELLNPYEDEIVVVAEDPRTIDTEDTATQPEQETETRVVVGGNLIKELTPESYAEPTSTSYDSTVSFAGGDGTASNPYQIQNVNQLQKIDENPSAHYELIANIDASGTSEWNQGSGFTPIGSSNDIVKDFTGTLDGNNYVINGLYVNDRARYGGLFADIENGVVENIGVTNADIYHTDRTGIIVGSMYQSTLRNSYATGEVNGPNGDTGGLVGYNFGSISNSYSVTNINKAVEYNDGSLSNVSEKPPYTTGSVVDIRNDIDNFEAQTVSDIGDVGTGTKFSGIYNQMSNGLIDPANIYTSNEVDYLFSDSQDIGSQEYINAIMAKSGVATSGLNYSTTVTFSAGGNFGGSVINQDMTKQADLGLAGSTTLQTGETYHTDNTGPLTVSYTAEIAELKDGNITYNNEPRVVTYTGSYTVETQTNTVTGEPVNQTEYDNPINANSSYDDPDLYTEEMQELKNQADNLQSVIECLNQDQSYDAEADACVSDNSVFGGSGGDGGFSLPSMSVPILGVGVIAVLLAYVMGGLGAVRRRL